MRKTMLTAVGLLLPLAVLACGETGTQQGGEMDEAAMDTVAEDTTGQEAEPGTTVSLSAKGESGVSGDVRLMPAGDSVRVGLSLTGLTEGQSYPAHVHTGNCQAGGGVAQRLNPVAGQAGGTGTSTTTVAASVFADTTYFIQAHGSGGTPVACGDLPPASEWQGEASMSGEESMSQGSMSDEGTSSSGGGSGSGSGSSGS